jgi:hypothetical protein
MDMRVRKASPSMDTLVMTTEPGPALALDEDEDDDDDD